jgi:hypothetical protein
MGIKPGPIVVPQTYHFHELVNWCAANYQVDKKLIVSIDGSRIIF